MQQRMLAARVHGINDLRVEVMDTPVCPEHSILVQVQACTICGTDVRIYRKGDYRAAYPVVIGHEIAGRVVETAAGVTTVKVGDRVCVAPGHGCGECRMCRAGYPNVCTRPHPSLGYKLNGGFAEYIAVPEHIFRLGFVNPIPEGLSFNEAALSEITACCIHAQNNSKVSKGDTVLIMGAGPAGIIHAHLSKQRGARRVLLTQRSPGRLERASSTFGKVIDRTIVSSQEDLYAAVMEETDGEGADVVFVCAPSREAQEAATKLIANRGRINFFGGLPKDDCVDRINANDLHYKEYFIAGASSSLPEDNREALRILSEKQMDPALLLTHAFPLKEIHQAFDVIATGECIKVVINPQKEME